MRARMCVCVYVFALEACTGVCVYARVRIWPKILLGGMKPPVLLVLVRYETGMQPGYETARREPRV